MKVRVKSTSMKYSFNLGKHSAISFRDGCTWVPIRAEGRSLRWTLRLRFLTMSLSDSDVPLGLKYIIVLFHPSPSELNVFKLHISVSFHCISLKVFISWLPYCPLSGSLLSLWFSSVSFPVYFFSTSHVLFFYSYCNHKLSGLK